MKKASKILTFILIVVFVLSVFAGCDLVGRDVGKYRSAQALQIGNETVTIGKLLDTFNNYYNNYYYYISMGYLDAEYLFQMTLNSLVRQYVIVNDYVQNNQPVNPQYKDLAHNAEYLTEEEFQYTVKYVTYMVYQSFDTNVKENVEGKFDLEDAATEDTSRDFTEADKLLSTESYAMHMFLENITSEEADDYFADYYPEGKFQFKAIDYDSYVYSATSAADKQFVEKRVAEFNDRLVDADDEATVKLSVEEYIQIQLDTIQQYKETIENNYRISMEEFFGNQLDDMVTSVIIAKWNYEVYKDLEKDEELLNTLQDNYNTLYAEFLAELKLNDNFDSFITGLSSDDYIYGIPEEHKQQYVFVKNILIPFSTEQTNLLKNLANTLGKTDRDEYINARNAEATLIEAKYFESSKYDKDIESKYFSNANWFVENTDKDVDGKYEPIKDIFVDGVGGFGINPNGVLGQFFNADGTVNAIDGLSEEETIVELMKRFNTDTAQHRAEYDYVVYVGEDWENYTHKWVSEFYTAVNEMRDVSGNFNGIGKYAIGISEYGVHIIYVVDYVDNFVYSYNYADRLNTETASYKAFSNFFEKKASNLAQEKSNELWKQYIDDNKLSIKDVFKVFIKENDFDFDFDEYLQEIKKEL